MHRVFLILVFLAAAPAGATTAKRSSLAELVNQSELVVVGTAGQPSFAWEGTRIVTRVPVRIEEAWVGEPVSEVEVVSLGGVVGDIGQKVFGALRLRAGERVVLCLQRRTARDYRVVQMAQGAFFISGTSADPPLQRRSFGMQVIGEVSPIPRSLRSLERAVREIRAAR